MTVCVFLTLEAGTTLESVTTTASALEAAGVTAVGFLDAADRGAGVSAFESSTLAAAIALTTSSIGIIASCSGVFGHPFHAARRLATLDHLSAGRSGWLLRTSTGADEATAYDWRSVAGRGEELHRCTEFAEIALELWDSWEEGAQWPDKDSGDFKDDSRIHPINYRSTSFRVAGPLDVPPSPQRRPVVFAQITTEQEARQLVPYIDVAIVSSPAGWPVTGVMEAVSAASHRYAASTEILIASSGGSPVSAADLPRGAAGVAVSVVPGDLDAVAALAQPQEPPAATLAAALGLELIHGGRAA